MTHTYLIALGSNIRHAAHGNPRHVLAAAFNSLGELGEVRRASRIIDSPPVGPSRRQYANAAALVESDLSPTELLALLKHTERSYGTRRGGRWRARVLDLDIILWSGGIWADPKLNIPHPLFRMRAFVLGPAREICPDWRDPITNLSLQQLYARLTQHSSVPKRAAGGWALSSVGRATDF